MTKPVRPVVTTPSFVVSNGTEAVAGYPAADYRIFEVGKDAELSLAGEWVVTPTNGATKVVITGLPEGETVAGVRIGEYVVPSAAFVGFGEGRAAVTVRAIPGLKYELMRWETLDAESAVSSKPPYQVVADKVAEGASVTLTDDKPPAEKAFYRVVVSVP